MSFVDDTRSPRVKILEIIVQTNLSNPDWNEQTNNCITFNCIHVALVILIEILKIDHILTEMDYVYMIISYKLFRALLARYEI